MTSINLVRQPIFRQIFGGGFLSCSKNEECYQNIILNNFFQFSFILLIVLESSSPVVAYMTLETCSSLGKADEPPEFLFKLGQDNLDKADSFERVSNWPEVLHYGEIAATKLKQLKNRPSEDISKALRYKFNALQFMGRYKDALECALEWYCLWQPKSTYPLAIMASLALIQSCILNNEFVEAEYYARTLFKTLLSSLSSHDNHIPEGERQPYVARGALELSRAIVSLAEAGGILPEEKQTLGQEAISLARRALAIDALFVGPESHEVAFDMTALGHSLECLYDNNDESIRLFEQAIVIFARVEGRMSMNVAVNERFLGSAHEARAKKVNDRDRRTATLTLALSRYYESSRIFRAINRINKAIEVERDIRRIEQPYHASARWIEMIFLIMAIVYIMFTFLPLIVLNSIGFILLISLILFLVNRQRPRLRRTA